ncbi:MAG TPA: SDR family oxidoreductase [Pyrinomonadaceae bacterium]|jgi:thioester reductase-like protein
MLFRESILLTGFPGFIASRLVERLAHPQTQFFLLVEPRFVEKAIEEVELVAEEQGVPLESFVIVEGDITRPNLGIASEDLDVIRAETTQIFHLAAVYDLAVEQDLATRVNLDGTKNVNALALSITNLRRYNYISTCYVAGKRTGRIRETELEHEAGFRNHYEETKYLAEREVERLKSQLPVTIFRPSVVVGDSETGETSKYDGIYYLIQYLRKAPSVLRLVNVGNDKVHLNLVPVDFVVDAIAALSNDTATIGKTLQIADPSPLTTAELFDTIAKELTGRKSEFGPPTRLVEWFLRTKLSPPITGLPDYGVPYFFIEQTYDTSLASNALKPYDISCPPFTSYVSNLLDFVDEFPTL